MKGTGAAESRAEGAGGKKKRRRRMRRVRARRQQRSRGRVPSVAANRRSHLPTPRSSPRFPSRYPRGPSPSSATRAQKLEPRGTSPPRTRRTTTCAATASLSRTHIEFGLEPRQHRTESPRDRGERSHPFTPGRFHVLLNSLSKVLFNFPSRYLSTIGLVPVFSLGWSLPPDLGCVPKQPDSRIEGRRSPSAPNGPGTRRGRPRSRELRTMRDENERLPSTHAPHVPKPFTCDGIRRWASPGSLAVTKGIPVGFFSSA